MAINLNSISFSVLLVVLVMASTGILKSEAGTNCPGGCSTASERVFLGECGPDPYAGTEADCCTCCKNTYKTSPNVPCWSAVEGTIKHCHCYKHV